MKHYRRKKRDIDTYYRKDQLCWTCKNACNGGCSWSREFIPVDGWIAEKTYIESNYGMEESYKIISCPKYEKE